MSSAGENWVVGVVLGLLGSVAINTGNNIQSLGLKRLQEDAENGRGQRKTGSKWPLGKAKTAPVEAGNDTSLLASQDSKPPGPSTSKIWVTGTLIFVSGSLLNFASYAFAAQSMLASLESIQFVTNLLFGKFMLGANVTKTMLFGTCLTVAGTIIAVQFSSKNTLELNTAEIKDLYRNPAYLAYLAMMVALLVLLDMVYRLFERYKLQDKPLRWSDAIMPLTYSIWSALFGTQSVVQAKVLAELLAVHGEGDEDIFHSWFTYATIVFWLVTVSVWLKRLNDALGKFNPLFIIPLLQCSFIFFAIVSGGIFFKEFNDFAPHQWVGFWCGVCVMFSGLVLLTPKQRLPSEELTKEVVSLLTSSEAALEHTAMAANPQGVPPSTPDNDVKEHKPPSERSQGGLQLLEEGDTGQTQSESTKGDDSEEPENDVGESSEVDKGNGPGHFLRAHRNTREKLSKAVGEAMKDVVEETAQVAALLFTPHNGTAALTNAMVDATLEKEKKMRMKENLKRLRLLMAEHPPARMGGYSEEMQELIRELGIDLHLVSEEESSQQEHETYRNEIRESLHTMFSPRTLQKKILQRATELEEDMEHSHTNLHCRPTDCIEDSFPVNEPGHVSESLIKDLDSESDRFS